MPEPKQEGVAVVADRITLEAVPLALVADPQLHPQRPLVEPDGLFIDGQELTRNPHILALLVEMINELSNLPQWVLLLLLLRIVLVLVAEGEVATKMLPPTQSWHRRLRRKVPLPHLSRDKVVPHQRLHGGRLKPGLDLRLWGESVGKENAHHLIQLRQIKRQEVLVSGSGLPQNPENPPPTCTGVTR
jgi:hypothetical protein